MGQFSQAMTEVEENLAKLLEEIGRLRHYIVSLEDENTRLKRQLCAMSDAETTRVQNNTNLIREQARENLDKLYLEGFHVCHIYFGEPLEGVCLFCNAFLQHERD
ncbi:MAG: DNA replication initiation control protein YabA [Peptococcaceae bacterium]|nr:DNA replication initiation control protein YabA [Peptococcaceae bacterium]